MDNRRSESQNGGMSALDDLITLVRAKNLQMGFAESCTGGLASSLLTAKAGVSDIFAGSVVCYSNALKMKLLGVQSSSLEKFGAVSETVVREMVKGARAQLGVGFAAAVTGIAGPLGGTTEKPVGTVWFACVGPQFELAVKKNFSGDRQQIQEQSAHFLFEFLLNAIRQH